jgi:hypothetical protein
MGGFTRGDGQADRPPLARLSSAHVQGPADTVAAPSSTTTSSIHANPVATGYHQRRLPTISLCTGDEHRRALGHDRFQLRGRCAEVLRQQSRQSLDHPAVGLSTILDGRSHRRSPHDNAQEART